MKDPNPRSDFLLLVIALALWAGVAAFHLLAAGGGFPIYRDQHLSPAVYYAEHGVDLLRPVIMGFNAGGTPTPQEFPFWQAAAGLAIRAAGGWYGAANLVSLLFALTILWPVYALARMYLGRRTACWSLLFLLTQPLFVLAAGQASVDGFSFAAAIWFLYFAALLTTSGSWPAVAGTVVMAVVTALSKPPFLYAYGLAALALLLLRNPRSTRAWVFLGLAGLVAIVAFLGWTHHCNQLLALAEFPQRELRVTHNPRMVWWYFGDLAFLLSPGTWVRAGWMSLNSLFGSFVLVVPAAIGLFARENRIGRVIAGSSLVAALTFSHLVLVHRHYYLMLTPAVAFCCALALVKLEEKVVPFGGRWTSAFPLLVAAGLCLSAGQGLMGMELQYHFDPYPPRVAGIVNAHTEPADRLLIQGGGWGGEVLMLAHRSGLTIYDPAIVDETDSLHRLQQLGYNTLVLITESPLRRALLTTNPGQPARPRLSCQPALSPRVQGWPALYQDEDVLIKRIP